MLKAMPWGFIHQSDTVVRFHLGSLHPVGRLGGPNKVPPAVAFRLYIFVCFVQLLSSVMLPILGILCIYSKFVHILTYT